MQNESQTKPGKKENSKSIFKNIVGFVLLLSVFIVYGLFSGVYSWGSNNPIITIIDVPSILLLFLYVLPLLAISGNFTILFKGLKTAFSGAKTDLKSKYLISSYQRYSPPFSLLDIERVNGGFICSVSIVRQKRGLLTIYLSSIREAALTLLRVSGVICR